MMATLPGIAQMRDAGEITVAEFDTYLPLLSLPRVFGTTPATIPATVPYIDVAALRRRKDATGLPHLPRQLGREWGWCGRAARPIGMTVNAPVRCKTLLLCFRHQESNFTVCRKASGARS